MRNIKFDHSYAESKETDCYIRKVAETSNVLSNAFADVISKEKRTKLPSLRFVKSKLQTTTKRA